MRARTSMVVVLMATSLVCTTRTLASMSAPNYGDDCKCWTFAGSKCYRKSEEFDGEKLNYATCVGLPFLDNAVLTSCTTTRWYMTYAFAALTSSILRAPI